jgi:hypothetical protein
MPLRRKSSRTSRLRRLVVVDQPAAIAALPWMSEGERAESGAIFNVATAGAPTCASKGRSSRRHPFISLLHPATTTLQHGRRGRVKLARVGDRDRPAIAIDQQVGQLGRPATHPPEQPLARGRPLPIPQQDQIGQRLQGRAPHEHELGGIGAPGEIIEEIRDGIAPVLVLGLAERRRPGRQPPTAAQLQRALSEKADDPGRDGLVAARPAGQQRLADDCSAQSVRWSTRRCGDQLRWPCAATDTGSHSRQVASRDS